MNRTMGAALAATRWLLPFACAASAAPAFAFQIYTVGADAGCRFTSIQAAIDAAAASPGEDYVWIANNQIYSGQHIVIQDQDVIVEGGLTDCSQDKPT